MTQLTQTAAPTPIYNFQVARENAVRTLVDFALQYRTDLAYRTAIAGDGMGTLDVPSTNRRIYVELGASGGDVDQAQYDQFHPNLGDAILLQRTRVMGTGGWLVIGFLKGDIPPCAN